MYFSDPGRSSASQIIPFFTGSTKSLTVAMWVQFALRERDYEREVFFTLYGVRYTVYIRVSVVRMFPFPLV